MYRLLIVDDEEDIRRGIARGIPWAQLGFEVAGQAGDGQEAVGLLEKTRPDVVLSDIRMPKMDGIELMQYLYTNNPEIKIIILSGYNDVEYLNMAIKNQVIEYLLKPTDIDEFCELFKSLKTKLDTERQQKRELESLKAFVEQSKELSYGRVLSNLLDGYIGGSMEYQWKQEMEARGMAFDRCVMVIMDTDPGAGDSKEDHYQLKQRIIQYCNSRQIPWSKQFFLNRDHKVVGIVTLDEREMEKDIQASIQEIQGEIGDIYNLALLAGISPMCRDESQLPSLYAQTVKTVTSKAPDLFVNQKKSSMLVNAVQEYLNSRYCSNSLSLEEVADHFRKNPAYISKVFKKETGFNFSDYITQKRMEKGKELLTDMTLKIYEIAELIGYADASNFIKVFKKHCGMSPNEYRSLFG